MKRKVENGTENSNPASQTSYGNPSKRIRTTGFKPGSRGDVKDEDAEELMKCMGVQYLEDDAADHPPVNIVKHQHQATKVLQPRDENRCVDLQHAELAAELQPADEADSGLGMGSTGKMVDESLDYSGISVGSFDGSSSYIAPSKDLSCPEKGFTSQQKILSLQALKPGNREGSKQGEGRDLINMMSDEVMLAMFRWLPKSTLARCARVCKRWHRLSVDESLWRRLDLGLVTVPPGVLGQVLSRGCQVLRLARASVMPPFQFINTFTNSEFPDILSSKLQYLDLSMASTSISCLEALLSSCKKLRKLSLEMNTLSDKTCEAVGQNKELEVLHIGGVSGLTPMGIDRILSGCRQLLELNLGWTGLSRDALTIVVDKLQPRLERLCLSGNRETLMDNQINRLGSSCPNLKELDLSDSIKLTAATLTVIQEKFPKLESLSTSRCYDITPSSYLMLASGCPSLRYLNIFGLLRDPAMVELKERLKGIEINEFMFTSVARPTVGIKRTSIWNLRVRD